MKTWAFAVGAAAALAVVLSLALQRARRLDASDELPRMIEDCHTRIQRLEAELHRLHSV